MPVEICLAGASNGSGAFDLQTSIANVPIDEGHGE
jgi:hypothetical protein